MNGSFFEEFADIAKGLLYNEGATSRAEQRLINKSFRDSGKKIAKNFGEDSDGARQAFADIRKEVNKDASDAISKGKPVSDAGILKDQTIYRKMKADGAKVLSGSKEADKAYKEAYSDVMAYTTGPRRTWEAAKGYFTDPIRTMYSETANNAAKSSARKQFIARTGAITGAATLGGGILHDMASDNEQDTGVGGIAVNTIGAAGLSAGAAAGMSMLMKL